VLYGLRGKIAYILHGHKGIVTSLSAQKGIYRSILSLIGLGFNLLYQMVLYLTCNFGPQGRPFICAPKVPTEKSSESYGQRCKLEMLVFIYAIIAPTALAICNERWCNIRCRLCWADSSGIEN
jgi:hypothetical protein